MSDLGPPAALIGILVRLRKELLDNDLLLETGHSRHARQQRYELVQQLDDYIIPRLVQFDAPLLTVVGGSTGAGKSTLVNSLVGTTVSATGVLRPTTRSPVLVHRLDDASWFGADRLLPELVRTSRATGDHSSLQLVATDRLPPGLAILDAPDLDSVEEQNRALAAQLLAAADLWLFVTSAARYADQVPWGFLQAAAERGTAVAVVLDRTDPAAVREVSSHLARMLTARGLGDSPLFAVPESAVDDGRLAPGAVAPIRAWLDTLAADATERATVVRKTLDGAISSLGRRTREISEALRTQQQIHDQLRADVCRAYADGLAAVDQASQDGTLLRQEVLARWQEFVGSGELLKSLEERVGRIRDRVMHAIHGRPAPTQRLAVALESGLELLVVEQAEASAERAALAWQALPAGAALLDSATTDLSRASRDLRSRAQGAAGDWQQGLLELVRTEGSDRRTSANFLAYGVNGLGVALMTVIFAPTAAVRGAEVGVAGGVAVVGQKILEAVLGDQAVRRLTEAARRDLHARVAALLDSERQRFLAVLDLHPIHPGAAQRVLDLAREVDDVRWAEDAL
ncbi:MAG: ABC transporter [Nocardioidaceae bacterium]